MSEIELVKSYEVSNILQLRHILDEDIKKVIANAEATGEKLYLPDKKDRYLAKLVIGTNSFYVEYSVQDGKYVIHTAYSHRQRLLKVY